MNNLSVSDRFKGKTGRAEARSDAWANIGHSASLAVDYLMAKRQELLEGNQMHDPA